MEIVPLGDSALIVRVVDDFSRDPEAALNEVLAALRALEAAEIPGVIELAPAYCTIGVFLDVPAIVRAASGQESGEWLTTRIENVLKGRSAENGKRIETRAIEIPVCYDREFALDLDDVARGAALPEGEVIRRHASGTYRVACVGFIGGFPFLSGLSPELATPRRKTPRKEVPAGSIAIGGAQTGIYPTKSPGGWNVVGRTPLRLFNVQCDPPAMLRAGDQVRFREISRKEFDSFPQ